MLRRCCPWWCAVSASSSAVAGVHKIVVPIEDFPPGWQPLTPQLAARAELGVGYHDDPRLRDENVPSYVRAAAAEVISHAPSSSDSSLPMDTLQAVASAQGVPAEEVEAAKGFAFKCFSMGDFGGTYRWMGHVAGLAREYDVEPIFDSFFTEVSVTLPLTEPGRKLAQYMNQQEIRQAPRRNTSDGVVAEEEADDMMLSDDVKERVEARALHSFCWILNNDRVSRDNFNQEIFLQWHHRADYLVKRKAREKKEFRDNLTLEELLKSASQNRRRRVAQVEERDRLRKEAQKIPSPPNFRAHAKRAFAVANRSARAEVIRKSLAVPDGAQTTNAFVKGGKANPPDVVPRFPSAPDVGSARDVADLYDENESNDMDEDDAAVDHSTDDDGSIKSVIEANRRSKETGEPRKKVRSSIDVVLDVLPRELREAMDGGDQPDGMDDVRLGGGNAPRFQGRFKI